MSYINKKWVERQFEKFAEKVKENFINKVTTATQSDNGLMSKDDKSKLDGIARGAEVNVQSDWNVTDNTSDAFIKNKPDSLPANGGTAETISDTLPIDKGGTGKTNGADAFNVLINSVTTETNSPVDNDYYISQYVGGGDNVTTYHRRPMYTLFNYIKNKLCKSKKITTDFRNKYRTQTNGNTNREDYISVLRCDTGGVPYAPQYGSGLAFGAFDTHGYLYMSYEPKKNHAYIGCGSGDTLNWVREIVTCKNQGYHTDNESGEDEWGINISGKVSGYSSEDLLNYNNLTNKPDANSLGVVKKTGDTMSDELSIVKSSGDTFFNLKRTDTEHELRFGIGAGGYNRGIYDTKINKWIFYADSNNNVHLAGDADTVDGKHATELQNYNNLTNIPDKLKKYINSTYEIGNNTITSTTGIHLIANKGNNNIYLRGMEIIACDDKEDTPNLRPICASSFITPSSRTVKKDITNITNEEAEKILNVNIVSFRYIKQDDNETHYGVIAEDVYKQIPSVVTGMNTDSKEKFSVASVDYSKFVPYLIKMLQMQNDKINEMNEYNKKLEERISIIEGLISNNV